MTPNPSGGGCWQVRTPPPVAATAPPDADPILTAVALDASILLEVLTPLVPALFLPMASAANVGASPPPPTRDFFPCSGLLTVLACAGKNVSWLAASASRAGIHASLAVSDNLADVTAKTGSQTIAASLLGAWAAAAAAATPLPPLTPHFACRHGRRHCAVAPARSLHQRRPARRAGLLRRAHMGQRAGRAPRIAADAERDGAEPEPPLVGGPYCARCTLTSDALPQRAEHVLYTWLTAHRTPLPDEVAGREALLLPSKPAFGRSIRVGAPLQAIVPDAHTLDALWAASVGRGVASFELEGTVALGDAPPWHTAAGEEEEEEGDGTERVRACSSHSAANSPILTPHHPLVPPPQSATEPATVVASAVEALAAANGGERPLQACVVFAEGAPPEDDLRAFAAGCALQHLVTAPSGEEAAALVLGRAGEGAGPAVEECRRAVTSGSLRGAAVALSRLVRPPSCPPCRCAAPDSPAAELARCRRAGLRRAAECRVAPGRAVCGAEGSTVARWAGCTAAQGVTGPGGAKLCVVAPG